MAYSYDRRNASAYDRWLNHGIDDNEDPPEPTWDDDIENDIQRFYQEALPKHFDANFDPSLKKMGLGDARYDLRIKRITVGEKEREFVDHHNVAQFEVHVVAELELTLDKPMTLDDEVLAEAVEESLGMSLSDALPGTSGKKFHGMKYVPEDDAAVQKRMKVHGEGTLRPKLEVELLFIGVGTGDYQGPSDDPG